MKKNIYSKLFITIMSFISAIALLTTFSNKVNVYAEEETYEVADEISVDDLEGSNGKIVLSKHQSFKFTQTAEHYSTVFSFIYKTENPDTMDCQFHFSTTWLGDGKGGKVWFRNDNIFISNDNTKENGYVEGDTLPSAGSYHCEIGKLYCLTGTNQGKYYVYAKVEDSLVASAYINEMPLISGMFFTGVNGDILIDNNWIGSKYTYKVGDEVYEEGSTINDYLTKPTTNPTKDGYEFIGWYDEMGYEWDFEKDVVRNNIVLRAGFKSLTPEVSDEVYFNDDNFTPVLRFMAESDVHISGTPDRKNQNLTKSINVAYQYAENNSKYKKLDAALFVGDVSDNGDPNELTTFNNTAKAALKPGTQSIVSMGNHDHRTGTLDEAITNWTNIIGAPDQHLVIGGYHFISLSPNMNTGRNFSDEKVAWLDQQLQLAKQADPTKPIFVMQHEGINGTVYGSDSWGVSELTSVLQKYPQVVDFSGHSHYPVSDPRSIWQGTFTALGTGTLAYYEMGINGYSDHQVFPTNKTGGWKKNSSAYANCAEYLIVEVDANNAIRVIAYDLVSDTEVARWYIRNVTDDVKTKYSHIERTKNGAKPEFKANTNFNLTTEQNTITVEFDQAICADVIDSYRIEVYEGTKLVKTDYALSDHFFVPTPSTLKVKLESLQSLTNYTIKVYAVSVWNKECDNPLIGNIKTEQAEAEVLEEPDRISVSDIQITGNNGIVGNISSEDLKWKYNGCSEHYSSVISYYLMVGELTSSDEMRVNVGNSWVNRNVVWFQKNDYSKIYFNFDYSSAPTNSVNFKIENNSIYKLEYGLIYILKGEHRGQWYTYLKINDVLKLEYYCDADERPQTDYVVTMHLTQGFKIADVNLARDIEYYVDGKKYNKDFTINGSKINEPIAPSKAGYFFIGWYDKETGGERVDFNNPIISSDKTIKYYARFTDDTHQVKFYNYDGKLYQSQTVGDDCKIIVPENPIKTGKYKYSFVKWVIKGTKEEFNINTRVYGDLELQAVFEEYKYKIVYLVDGIQYLTKYYIESNAQQIIGGEPATPEIEGALGYWVYSAERKNADIYASARYDGLVTTPSNNITLNKFNGASVDIADDLTRFYLSFTNTEDQIKWINEYSVSGGHERQDLTFSWTDTKNNKSYLVYFADNRSFENAFIIKTQTNKVDYVGIFTPGKTYYWKVLGLNNLKWSEVDSFTVLDTPIRWISAGPVFNVRDIGGWTTIDNKMVNYGLIYRGGQLSLDSAGETSYMNAYSFKVFDYLGMKTEIELRGGQEHELNQFNELCKVINVNGTGYTAFININDARKAQYREIFAALADINNYPIYFHCSWGADRTGSLAFLISGVLGVPYEQLAQDYELTSFSYSGSRTRNEYSGGMFDEMKKAFMDNYATGDDTLQDAIYKYLINVVGVEPSHIASLKQIMLSEASAILPTYQVTYRIDGEVYQVSNVIAGNTINSITPLSYDRFLKYWTVDGVIFDSNTHINSDLILDAVFEDIVYEDYDVITIRDFGMGEQLIPTDGQFSYYGTATNHSRLLEFNYTIAAEDGTFNDGVHIEMGANTWAWKAHIWFADASQIYAFTDGPNETGNSSPTGNYSYLFEMNKTYKITVGVIIPLNGENAGKKMLLLKINDEVICYIPTTVNLSNNYTISFAGTEGILKSVENKMTVQYLGPDGNILETKEVQRGFITESINYSEPTDNKIFLGWFDEYGNSWDFETSKVYNNTKLYAKYGDRSIDAIIVDKDGREIQCGYKVKTGTKVEDIIIPTVHSNELEFDGWYNGNAKLNSDDIINENMELICKFNIKDTKPIDPADPSKKGCKSMISTTYELVSMLSLVGLFFIRKKRNEE